MKYTGESVKRRVFYRQTIEDRKLRRFLHEQKMEEKFHKQSHKRKTCGFYGEISQKYNFVFVEYGKNKKEEQKGAYVLKKSG